MLHAAFDVLSSEAIVMPLGPKGGVGYIPLLWGITLGDFFTRLLKGKNLFADMAKKSVTA